MPQEKPAYRVYVVGDSARPFTEINLTDLQNAILPDAREAFFRRNVRLTDELKPGQTADVRLICDGAAAKQGYVIKKKILEVYRMTQADYAVLEAILHSSECSHLKSRQAVKGVYEGRLEKLREEIRQLEAARDFQLTRVGPAFTLRDLLQMYVNEHGKAAQEGKQKRKK